MQKTALITELSLEERQTLLRLVRKRKHAAYLRHRSLIVLLGDAGIPVSTIAELVGICPQHVYRWLTAWQEARLVGLQGTGHQGRPTRGQRRTEGAA